MTENLRLHLKRHIVVRIVLLLMASASAADQVGLDLKPGETFELAISEKLEVQGNLTIHANDASAAQLRGANNAEILVSGNWINDTSPDTVSSPSGFVHNNTIVYLTGTAGEYAQVKGNTTFYQLIADKTLTDDKKFIGKGIKFESGRTQTIVNQLDLRGSQDSEGCSDELEIQSIGADNHILSVGDATVNTQCLKIEKSSLSGTVKSGSNINVSVDDDSTGWLSPRTTIEFLSISQDTGRPGDFITEDNDGLIIEARLSAPLRSVERVHYSTNNGNDWDDITDVAVAGMSISYNDDNLTSTATLKMRVADDAGNYGKTASQEVQIIDDGAFGVTVDPGQLEMKEGEVANLIVKANFAPIADTIINLNSSDDAEVMVSPSTLTFTPENWAKERQVVVTAIDDSDMDNVKPTITLSVGTGVDRATLSTVTIAITNTDANYVSLIESFNNGDGTTPPPPTLAIYKAIEINNIPDDKTLALVNVEVLIQDVGGADTKEKIVALVEKVIARLKAGTDDEILSASTVNAKDEAATYALEKYAANLASISISNTKSADGTYKVDDRIDDHVSVGQGLEDVGDQDGLIDIDGIPGVEVYIRIDDPATEDIEDFLWNPTADTFESVNLEFANVPGGSHEISDVIGYPMGMEGKSMALSNRPSFSIVTREPGHSLYVYGFSDGQWVALTDQLTSATSADDNGQYPLVVTPSDYVRPLDIGDNMLVLKGSISWPMPTTVVEPSLKFTMAANRKQVIPGSTVTYSMQLENESSVQATKIAIKNNLPLGLKYIEGSAYWDHDDNPETAMQKAEIVHRDGRSLHFNMGDIDSMGKRSLRYQLRVGNGVNKGTYSNSAVAIDNNGTPDITADDAARSAVKSVDIRVVEDPLFELSTVIGKVFNDINGDGIQDPGDKPVPYAQLITSSGQQIRADGNGQYHLAAMRPGRVVVRLDQRSLPDGTSVIGHASKVVDVRSGIPTKVNFAVQLPHDGGTTSPVRIEQLPKMLKPSLNVAVFGSAYLRDDPEGFVAPVEIRAYSNYPTFISQWQLLIAEDFSRRVVKTFSGTASDFYTPLYWDGSTDDAEIIDPALNYTVQLIVSDKDGRQASTYRRGVNMVLLRDQFAPELDLDREWTMATPLDTESKSLLDNSEHSRWLQRLVEEDSTERSHIRVMGKSIRISGDRYSAVRIAVQDPAQEIIEIPSYSSQATSLIGLMRGVSMLNDSSDESVIELILPRTKLNVQVLTHASVTDTNSQQPAITADRKKADADIQSQQTLEKLSQEPQLATADRVPEAPIPVPIVKPHAVAPALGQQIIELEDNPQVEDQVLNELGDPAILEQPSVDSDRTEQPTASMADSENNIQSQQQMNDAADTASTEQLQPEGEAEKTQAEEDRSEPASQTSPKIQQLEYSIPTISSEFIAMQQDYQYAIQLQLSNNRQELQQIANKYQQSLDISRFAVIDMPHHAGSRYALIYGLYKASIEAERALGKVAKVLRNDLALKNSLQIRPLRSMHKDKRAQRTSRGTLFRLGYVLKEIGDFVFPKAYAAELQHPNSSIRLMSDTEAENWLLAHRLARQPFQSDRRYHPSWSDHSQSDSMEEHQIGQDFLPQPLADHYQAMSAGDYNTQQRYQVPAVSIEFLLRQEEYQYTLELGASADPQQLMKIAEDYSQTQNISRFALLIVAKGDGNYALIYGVYKNHKQAKRTLEGELPRALADAGAQIRSIQSMGLRLQSDLGTATKSPIPAVSVSQAIPQVIFDQQVDVSEITPTNDYFLVGIIDTEIAYRDLSGHVDLAKSGDAVYRDKIWKDGKVQLYYKGTVAGEYLITASIDSERDSHDLFSNLDPDASYALYGDGSSVNNLAAESDGPLYLLVERDTSWAKWGSLQVALTNSQLASFQRSLQGGQVHYESVDSTAYGQPQTEADVFIATTYQKSAHIEFQSTGSSLYYLKHQGALRDSLRLRVEVRDRFSGNVKTSRQLTLGDDYQFDSGSGRISFWRPPEREVESELLIGGERGAVDDIYLVADYSYSIADDWSQGVSGGQIQQALGDRMVLGVTQVDEQQQGGTYNLEAVNSTLHLSDNHHLRLEYARSESRAEPKYLSTDGGLSWGINESEITVTDSNQSGDAISLQGDAIFLDGRTELSYYARDIAEGFSSGGSHHQRGQRAAGVDISHRVNQDLALRFKHDRNSQLGAGDAQSNRRSGARDSDSSSLHASYKVGDKLTLSGELRHQVSSGEDLANRGADNQDSSALALQGRYRFDADTELRLTQQASIGSDADNQTRIAVRKRFSDRLSLESRVSHDDSGVAYGLDSAYNLHDKLSLNTGVEQDSQGSTTTQLSTGYSPTENSTYNLGLQQRRSDQAATSQSLNLGSSHQLNDSTALGAGASFALSGENRRQSNDANISHRLADGRELRGAVSRYTQQEDDHQHSDGHEINLGADIDRNWSAFLTLGQGDIHRIDGGLDKRRNFALGGAYIRADEDQQQQLKGRLRYEQRSDRGQHNSDTQRLKLDIKGRLNPDITLLGALNWGQSKDLDNQAVLARNNRFDLSAAYRPVDTDQLNIIGKYSWVEDRQPEGQAGDIGFEWQKGHVLATDVLFDLNAKWQIGGKLAVRHGEEKMPDLPWNDTRRWLLATRVGYRLQKDTLLNIEYRLLKDQTADDQRDGTVIELVRRFNNKIEVGIGINYAGFSDDLGLNDYTEQRGYLRITGVLE